MDQCIHFWSHHQGHHGVAEILLILGRTWLTPPRYSRGSLQRLLWCNRTRDDQGVTSLTHKWRRCDDLMCNLYFPLPGKGWFDQCPSEIGRLMCNVYYSASRKGFMWPVSRRLLLPQQHQRRHSVPLPHRSLLSPGHWVQHPVQVPGRHLQPPHHHGQLGGLFDVHPRPVLCWGRPGDTVRQLQWRLVLLRGSCPVQASHTG